MTWHYSMAMLDRSRAKSLAIEIVTRASKMGLWVQWREDRGQAWADLDHIVTPRIRYDIDYLVALHELGHHAVYRHDPESQPIPTYWDEWSDVDEEAQVWKWAIENSSIPISPEMVRQAQWDLGTYKQHAIDTFQGEDLSHQLGPEYDWVQNLKPTPQGIETGTDDEIGWVAKVSDYNGWTNWETWNTKLMMDNEQDLYNQSRELVRKYMNDPEKGRQKLEDWAVTHIIGPHNQSAIEDAKEWNSIPEEERLDYNYEDLKERNPDAADLVDNLGFGPDVSDSEPMIIDHSLVNWDEIWNSMVEDENEEAEYERQKTDYQNQGIGWATNHDLETNQMRDAFYRYHGAEPDEELEPLEGQKSTWNHPNAYHNITLNIPFEHVAQGAGGYRWPDDFITPETRVKMWNTFGHDYEKIPNIWEDPKAQEILAQDPRASEIMQNGYNVRLHDHWANVYGDIQHGRPNPYIKDMVDALEWKGYSPQRIQELMKQRWRWNPETQEHIDLTKDYDAAPPIDKSLDQPGDLTIPEDWPTT